jgi:PadR family transcriptional regulator PadR
MFQTKLGSATSKSVGRSAAGELCSGHLHFSNLFIIVEEMGGRTHLGDVELIVMLALLRLGENAYGVPISSEIELQSGREVALGSVYATLERLQEKGLVSSNLGEPTAERGGRAKRYFRVTIKGLREVRETRQALMKLWHGLRELQGERV